MKLLQCGTGPIGGPSHGHGQFALCRCKQCGKTYKNYKSKINNCFCCASHKAIYNKQKNKGLCKWCGLLKDSRRSDFCSRGCGVRYKIYKTQQERWRRAQKAFNLMLKDEFVFQDALMRSHIDKPTMCVVFGCDIILWAKETRARFNASGIKGHSNKPPTISQQMMIKGSEARNEVSRALRIWRKTKNTHKVGIELGHTGNSGSGILLRSSVYKKLSKKRIKESKWRAKEINNGYRKADLTKEKDIQSIIARELTIAGFNVKEEFMAKDWSKVDIYASHGVFRYAIEIKASSRKSRIAGCVGQSLIASCLLDAVPVACVPSCFNGHHAINKAMGLIGGVVVTEENITRKLCDMSGIDFKKGMSLSGDIIASVV